VGLLVLILPEVLAGQASGGTVVAKIACVAAALCYSVGAILIRRAPPIPPIAFTAGTFALRLYIIKCDTGFTLELEDRPFQDN
jgi:drug/metabolite transporter (DMT)-like permease